MKFFLPPLEPGHAVAEKNYGAIRRFIEENNFPTDGVRYCAVTYSREGRWLTARVGEPDPLTGELVIAIFRASHESGPFMICTPNRGVERGGPILADGGHQTTSVAFTE